MRGGGLNKWKGPITHKEKREKKKEGKEKWEKRKEGKEKREKREKRKG